MSSFREFIGKIGARYHVRLGHTVYASDYRLNAVFIVRNGDLFELTDVELNSKPWIMRNMRQEITFQRRKEAAIMFQQPCFQREHRYSKNQRMAYHNSKYNGVI